MDVLNQARQTLRLEAEAIVGIAARLDGRFVAAVERLLVCSGRVVVTGMGKSGIIGRKIAATLASTGTPALFLHPAEGSHGDLGMVTRQDVVIALSNSGETPEVLALLPVLKRLGIGLIALVGRERSALARDADIVLDVGVEREACPMNLTPTCSTTAALAMGDALAVALLERRGFGPEDFAVFHPGGQLGRKLLLRVRDLIHAGSDVPLVASEARVQDAVLEMTAKRLGMTGVVDAQGGLVGILTDGDLRRHLDTLDLLNRPVHSIMTVQPKSVGANALAMEAVRRMETAKITSLFALTTDPGESELDGWGSITMDGHYVMGVIHLHDLLAAGLV